MKKISLFLISFICLCKVFAQNDYATINLFRSKSFVGSAVKVDIFVNGKNVCKLSPGGQLEFKIYTTNNIELVAHARALGIDNYSNKLTFTVQKSKTYNFFLKPDMSSGLIIEQILTPKKKAKSKKFIATSDVENNLSEVYIYQHQHPKTIWTKEKLIDHWSSNSPDPIEGIYERVGAYLKYNLAIVKKNNEYELIYLSGADKAGWKEGELKATLQKTAQFGLFKSNWFMLNKSLNKDVIIKFEKATMKIILESGNGEDLYLKIYPTYDEANNYTKSEWKSTGTGFFIDRRGYLVTNYHVIENGNTFEIDVTKKGNTKEYKAEIVSVDKQNDLAILKINDNTFSPLLTLNYNFKTEIQAVGSSVFTLGYPLTQIMGNEIKFTDGKISSKSGFQGDITTYQISVPVQPGNSGGPLFDEQGNLVGIISSGVNKQLADNANYAIKTSYLKLLIDSTNDRIELPSSSQLKSKSLTEQIETLSKYVVMIKVK